MNQIQCNVCETDEAALCWSCDEKLHTANKLAEKHQRVPLSVSSSSIPKCDICQILPVSRKIISSMTYQWVGSSISQVSLGHLECLLEVQASLPCSKYVLYICV
ncbi:hypothetical protein Bca52824_010083 [Brassica carinata]|uniref:B box-type domain-containing protein n=1 Tax=Brassica carinata TaxID=52824 RepID=A0A8X8B9T0_BRACI|nr:hypothetical protein Bca52824_010083 [Brassica carinata]